MATDYIRLQQLQVQVKKNMQPDKWDWNSQRSHLFQKVLETNLGRSQGATIKPTPSNSAGTCRRKRKALAAAAETPK